MIVDLSFMNLIAGSQFCQQSAQISYRISSSALPELSSDLKTICCAASFSDIVYYCHQKSPCLAFKCQTMLTIFAIKTVSGTYCQPSLIFQIKSSLPKWYRVSHSCSTCLTIKYQTQLATLAACKRSILFWWNIFYKGGMLGLVL